MPVDVRQISEKVEIESETISRVRQEIQKVIVGQECAVRQDLVCFRYRPDVETSLCITT